MMTLFYVVISFGILIFVHELGHFIVAKFFGVRIEIFSLGFGTRIFGFRKGDTDYRVSLIPLGGYVKMAGQFDIPDEESMKDLKGEPWEFPSKPWWQRFCIASAGSLMNIFLAFFILAFIAYFMGFPQYESTIRVGLIDPDMPEYSVFQRGDIITQVNGQKLESWDDLIKIFSENEEKTILCTIKRNDQIIEVPFQPHMKVRDNGTKQLRFGLDAYLKPVIGSVIEEQPASKGRMPLIPGDEIIAIDQTKIELWTEMRDLVASTPDKTLKLTIRRSGPFVLKMLTDADSRSLEDNGLSLTTHEENKMVVTVKNDSPAWKAGFLPGDMVNGIDFEKIPYWKKLLYKITGKTVQSVMLVTVIRPEPFEREITTVKHPINGDGLIGISSAPSGDFREIGTRKLNFSESIIYGFDSTVFYSQMIFITLKKLLIREVSVDNLAGAVGITQMIGQQAELGFRRLLEFLAILSVNLGIVNFFPIPVLDGGMMVVLLVEGVRRKPLTLKFQIILQQIGLLILIPLILYVTYNDIVRWLRQILTP